MRGKQTLVINGKVYDAVTGLPVAAPEPVPTVAAPRPSVKQDIVSPLRKVVSKTPHHAKHAHVSTRKSVTLRREFVKKPVGKAVVGAQRRKPALGHVEKSPMVQRFAPHPHPLRSATPKPTGPVSMDIAPARHVERPAAIVAQKHALVSAPAPKPATTTAQLSSRSVKEQLIAEKLASIDLAAPKATPKRAKAGMLGLQPRALSVAFASLAIVILGGYLTYLNMPGLSVRVAAAQAEVAATFPEYHPDGYRFSGPVAYAPGQVAINFVANGGTQKYTVTEQKSTWDSQAVYDHVVAKASEDNYVTNSQQGLTIYTFEGDAAWVNKGILYTISGDAPLSNEQLLRIAGSL